MLAFQARNVCFELVPGQVHLVVVLAGKHLGENFDALAHYVQLLPQRHEADAVVEVAVRCDVLLLHDLQGLVAAAKDFYTLEARPKEELVNDVAKGCHKQNSNVDLSLLSFEDLFRADIGADRVTFVDS